MDKKKSLVGWARTEKLKLRYDRRIENKGRLFITPEITKDKEYTYDKKVRITVEEL